MGNKFKKGREVLFRNGIKPFVFLIYRYCKQRVGYLIILALKKRSIRNLKNFLPKDSADAFSFVNKKFFGVFAPMQIRNEFLSLLDIFIKENSKIIMEIGTANGGTLFCFSKLAPDDAIIISLDLPESKIDGWHPMWKDSFYQAFAKTGQDLLLLREDSHAPETLEKVREVLGEKEIDFLFIDGDHSYEGVKKDFEMYGALVRKGGMIAFHDIVPFDEPSIDGGVSRFWKEIAGNYKNQSIVKDADQSGRGIGILFI